MGLLDPVSWRNNRWTAASAVMMKGRIKWKAKNRVSVALFMEKPPQIHSTRVVPIYGIAESRYGITVAPHNDICPQGRAWPINAVAMTVSCRIIPMFHVS